MTWAAPLVLVLHLVPSLGRTCMGVRKDLCLDPGSLCEMSSFEECPCAEGYWPQFDRTPWKEKEVHFGCCAGRGISACGPQKAPIRTFAEVSSSICLICILLTTVVIHYRQPQLSKIKSGDSAIENSPLVHDGAKLHAEVPMDRWCVSLDDLKQFKRMVGQAVSEGRICPTEMDPFDPKDYTCGPSMYTVTEQYIKPVTAAAGNVSWALMKNPDGLPCDVFITHAWAEGIYEFVDRVVQSWPRGGRAAYVCFLSNPQNMDIADLISTPEESPFAKALDSCRHVLAVPNRRCSIYSRLWCVYEAFLAYSWNKPITNATSSDFNAWAYLLRMFFINHASISAGLLLPLEFARKFYFPCTILIVPFMILFLLSLSFGKCGGYKSHLQKFVVIALTVLSNVSFACDTSMGHIFFEENWLFAVEYIMLGVIGTIAMELDRLNSVSADESAEDLRRGYSGRLSDAGCSEEADKLKILTEVKRSGHERDVEEAVKVLMKMNISTPELRATVERTGTLTDASHWSRAILFVTFIAFPGQTPFILLKYGHHVLGMQYGSFLHYLLIVLSTLSALAFAYLFMVLPVDRKAFAARVQSFWMLLWPAKIFLFLDGHGHPLYYVVLVGVYPPLLLAMSIMGPAKTARIPFFGPRLVRLVFGKPLCLKRFGCCARKRQTAQTNQKTPLPLYFYGFSEKWRF
ncbi:Protein MAK16-like A [Durusdinium trenchii]|uniref:Protein MAK16-like A n=1 Tax=Durusdinium trenchii TaxID=1381693 RepID=A0ABP0QXR1_9DINO